MSRSIRVVRSGFALSVALVGLAAAPAGAAPGGAAWIPPVSGPVVRGFDPPDSAFGPGHLGVDFAVAPGTPVHAAGDGVVVFAGRVGTALHVVTRHPGAVRTTDSFLATVAVVSGETVRRGAVLGTSGGTGAGHGAGVLHFGVRVGDAYIDPMLLFAPPDLAAVVHLAEPRRGAASDGSPDSGALAERAAIAAEARVDGRAVAPPPAWWSDSPSAAEKPAAVRAAPAVATATRPATGSSGANPAVVATPVVVAALGGTALRFRRLRRRRGPGRPWKASDYTASRPGSSGPSEPGSPFRQAMKQPLTTPARDPEVAPPELPVRRPRGRKHQPREARPWPSWKRRSQPS